MTFSPRTVLLTAAVALFACWFVYARPLVAAAFVIGALCIVGFVAAVGFVGWLVFVWGADRVQPELDDDGLEAAHDEANRW